MARKKLRKVINGNKVLISEAITGEEMEFDFADLPRSMQERLGPFGLGHKLGDAAAGLKGKEAVDAIQRVWENLKNGDWSSRVPRGPSVPLGEIKEGMAKLSPREAEVVRELLGKLNIKI